jgi:hypothetical protein
VANAEKWDSLTASEKDREELDAWSKDGWFLPRDEELDHTKQQQTVCRRRDTAPGTVFVGSL